MVLLGVDPESLLHPQAGVFADSQMEEADVLENVLAVWACWFLLMLAVVDGEADFRHVEWWDEGPTPPDGHKDSVLREMGSRPSNLLSPEVLSEDIPLRDRPQFCFQGLQLLFRHCVIVRRVEGEVKAGYCSVVIVSQKICVSQFAKSGNRLRMTNLRCYRPVINGSEYTLSRDDMLFPTLHAYSTAVPEANL